MRILKIESLAPKAERWIDRDEIMLHSCFQILKDYVEKEHGDTHHNYEVHKELVDEIRFLYGWWIKRAKIITSDEQMKEDDLMLIRLMEIRGALWT